MPREDERISVVYAKTDGLRTANNSMRVTLSLLVPKSSDNHRKAIDDYTFDIFEYSRTYEKQKADGDENGR